MADKRWYFLDEKGNKLGPLSDADMWQLHIEAAIAPDTQVWREGLSGWQALHVLLAEIQAAAAANVAADTAAAEEQTCPACAKRLPKDAVRCGYCGAVLQVVPLTQRAEPTTDGAEQAPASSPSPEPVVGDAPVVRLHAIRMNWWHNPRNPLARIWRFLVAAWDLFWGLFPLSLAAFKDTFNRSALVIGWIGWAVIIFISFLSGFLAALTNERFYENVQISDSMWWLGAVLSAPIAVWTYAEVTGHINRKNGGAGAANWRESFAHDSIGVTALKHFGVYWALLVVAIVIIALFSLVLQMEEGGVLVYSWLFGALALLGVVAVLVWCAMQLMSFFLPASLLNEPPVALRFVDYWQYHLALLRKTVLSLRPVRLILAWAFPALFFYLLLLLPGMFLIWAGVVVVVLISGWSNIDFASLLSLDFEDMLRHMFRLFDGAFPGNEFLRVLTALGIGLSFSVIAACFNTFSIAMWAAVNRRIFLSGNDRK
ncbi:MAG: DUF4339 domain-containing protein [Proteobacteria bacterium]|nr:DUF4339 domain-containing protein [Pseudomonadota bacterium]